MCTKSLQSCLTLCNPVDSSPSGFSVRGILQARILEWVALPFSRDISDPGIELASLTSPALAGKFFTTSTTWEPPKSSLKPVTKKRGWGIFFHSLSFGALVLNCFSWFGPHKALLFFSTSGSNHYCSLTDDFTCPLTSCKAHFISWDLSFCFSTFSCVISGSLGKGPANLRPWITRMLLWPVHTTHPELGPSWAAFCM